MSFLSDFRLRFDRRGLLRWAAAGVVAGLAPALTWAQKASKNAGIKRWPKAPATRNPRYLKDAATSFVATKLKPGFYVNPRSKVVHYVAQDGRIRQVQRINVSRLRPLAIADVSRLLLADTAARVHLTTASRALEEAALDHFKRSQPDVAFQLLATAIRHDQRLKQQSNEMPSLRLYDLYAAKAVQLGDKAKLDALLGLARQGDQQVANPAPLKTGRVQTTRAKSPISDFHRWQADRKAKAKAAAIQARKVSYSARLKKWATSGSSSWSQKWAKKDTLWKL